MEKKSLSMKYLLFGTHPGTRVSRSVSKPYSSTPLTWNVMTCAMSNAIHCALVTSALSYINSSSPCGCVSFVSGGCASSLMGYFKLLGSCASASSDMLLQDAELLFHIHSILVGLAIALCECPYLNTILSGIALCECPYLNTILSGNSFV